MAYNADADMRSVLGREMSSAGLASRFRRHSTLFISKNERWGLDDTTSQKVVTAYLFSMMLACRDLRHDVRSFRHHAGDFVAWREEV